MYSKSLASLLLTVTFANPLLGAGAVIKAQDNLEIIDTEVERTLEKLPEIKDDSREVTLRETTEDIVSKTKDFEIEIPKDSDEPVVLKPKGNKPKIEITLPETQSTQEAEQIAGNMVAYESEDTFSNIIQPTEDGVRFMTIIEDASAPTEYIYDLTLPEGGNIELTPEGAALVYGADHSLVFYVEIPWAKDGEGTDVKTWFEVRGDQLVQYVDHTSGAYRYPITADPWYQGSCSSYTDSVWTEWRNGYETIRIAPNNCARYKARWNHQASFQEVLHKSGRWNLTGNNLHSVWYQWVCHTYYAAFDPTWDLEIGTPNLGYWETVMRRCNPHGPRIY